MEEDIKSPSFDPAEQYVIASYRRSRGASSLASVMLELPVLVVGGLFLGWGLATEEPSLAVIGFGCLVFRLLHLAFYGAKFQPVFLSIIEKYEAALRESRGGSASTTEDTGR